MADTGDEVRLKCDTDYCPTRVIQESDFDFKKIERGCYYNTIDDFQKTGNDTLDKLSHRSSRGIKNSSEDCINACKAGKTDTGRTKGRTNKKFMNYHYAALESGGSCFCGSAEPQQELDLSECPMTCSADETDYCGAKNHHATIYYIENTISTSFVVT